MCLEPESQIKTCSRFICCPESPPPCSKHTAASLRLLPHLRAPHSHQHARTRSSRVGELPQGTKSLVGERETSPELSVVPVSLVLPFLTFSCLATKHTSVVVASWVACNHTGTLYRRVVAGTTAVALPVRHCWWPARFARPWVAMWGGIESQMWGGRDDALSFGREASPATWRRRGSIPLSTLWPAGPAGCWYFLASLLKIDHRSILSNGTRNVGCWHTISIATSER